MRQLFGTAIVLTLLLSAGVGLAQTPPADGEVQTRFYDFNDMLIDGEFMRPEGLFTRARDRARFERLLNLRREFMEEIEDSAKEASLE